MCVCVRAGVCCTHGAALVTEFTVTQQTPALVDASVPLSLVQILQLVDVVAALGLPLLHVDVGQDAMDDADLDTRALPFITPRTHFAKTFRAEAEEAADLLPHPDSERQGDLLECASGSL